MIKKILLTLLTAVVLTSTVTNVNAAEFRVPTGENDSIIISETETPKNLYTAGGNITVNAPVTGDLTIAGGQVMVTGDVADSLLAAGGTVSVRGDIGRTARVTGGDVTISGTVGGDLLIAGGSVIITSDAVINGDLLIAGGQVTLDGIVKGVVRAATGSLALNSSVGSLYAEVGTLTIGSRAVINGDLIYTANAPAVIDSNATITGVTTYSESKAPNSAIAHFLTVSSLMTMLGMILLLLLLIRFRPQFSYSIWTRSMSSPANTIGYGALGIFIAPLVLLAIAVTVVGLPIAIVLFFLWLTLLLLAMIYAQLILGMWIVQKLTKTATASLDWQAAVVGVLASGVLGLIPFIGWLINFILFLLAFGVLLSGVMRREGSVSAPSVLASMPAAPTITATKAAITKPKPKAKAKPKTKRKTA